MRYLLCDGNHIASRARHAQASLRTSDGRRSGVVYGVLQSISYMRNYLKLGLDQIWVVWDHGRAEARTALYPDYKKRDWKGEDRTPEEEREVKDYYTQLQALNEGLTTTGIRQVRVKGCEADDLIAITAASLHADGHEVIIATGDKDFHQLGAIAQFFCPKRDLITWVDDLSPEYGLPYPFDYLYSKAVRGDPSDNIPGVPGLGEVKSKRAALLCGRAPADKKDEKILALVKEHEQVVQRNLVLMTLPRSWEDFPHYTMEQLEDYLSCLDGESKMNRLKFMKFLKQWELDSIIDRLERW